MPPVTAGEQSPRKPSSFSPEAKILQRRTATEAFIVIIKTIHQVPSRPTNQVIDKVIGNLMSNLLF